MLSLFWQNTGCPSQLHPTVQKHASEENWKLQIGSWEKTAGIGSSTPCDPECSGSGVERIIVIMLRTGYRDLHPLVHLLSGQFRRETMSVEWIMQLFHTTQTLFRDYELYILFYKKQQTIIYCIFTINVWITDYKLCLRSDYVCTKQT